MGKNKKEQKKFLLRIDEETYEKVENIADAMKVSVNTVVNWSVEAFVDKAPEVIKIKPIKQKK